MQSVVAGNNAERRNGVMGKPAGCESIQEIINIAATSEALAVTLLAVALQNADMGRLAVGGELHKVLKAARAEEQAHYAHLTRSGAKAFTTTFTIPNPALMVDVSTFLKTLINLEEISSALYLAAAQEFIILGNSGLAEVAIAIASVEAAHRVALRVYAIEAGVISGPPNDIAFSKSLFASTKEAESALRQLGFIGGSGAQIIYPGPGTIDYAGIKELTP